MYTTDSILSDTVCAYTFSCNIKSMKAFISWCFAGSDARRPCRKTISERQTEESARTKLDPEFDRPGKAQNRLETGSCCAQKDLKPEAVIHKQT
jgi:hypothetical protein